ncbi:MAG: hypothetical protein KDB36_03285 [Acidimicrobiales bacterium]|nr:hypothetical protein [Acidimicrobiales bacterium]
MTSVDAGSGASSRRERLDAVIATVTGDLDAAHAAREAGLPACRRATRAAGSSIRATHRLEFDRAELLLAESEHEIRAAQAALAPFPALVHAGFLADAEKEFVEARLVLAFVRDEELPGPDELAVGAVAWMKGLAEAASELRRHLLDRLRGGDLARGEELLGVMDDAYDALVRVDYPDAITAGLRRTLDALRAVLERTRGDVTTTVLQTRLQRSIDAASA